MKALIIIPTYNEKENIHKIVQAVLKQDKSIEVLIVDDNSPDGTAEIVQSMMESNQRIHLLQRAGKFGLGSAYIAGFKYAIQNEYDYIFEMDADFSHNPELIPEFLREIKHYDLVIGSRYVNGVNVVNWPFRRLLISYIASKYVRFITGIPVKDPTSGYKCFRKEVLQTINIDKVLSDGYSFQIEINYKVWKKGFRIKEIPIIFIDRRSGQSKMSKKIIIEAMFVVWQLKFFNKLWYFLKKK
ncbi:MAG: polyprenol monophosphomannose synthase [Candidatus Cloacimonadota bacterium]|nr:MAG: polyprenol monophosphomannose synthase [Candidatus Cloacimonadota bacterium]